MPRRMPENRDAKDLPCPRSSSSARSSSRAARATTPSIPCPRRKQHIGRVEGRDRRRRREPSRGGADGEAAEAEAGEKDAAADATADAPSADAATPDAAAAAGPDATADSAPDAG